MEDPTHRSNLLPEEQPATGDAGASEQAAKPAEAESAPAQPSEKAAPEETSPVQEETPPTQEETPPAPPAQDPAAPEAPATPPAEHTEPEDRAAAPAAAAQAKTAEAPAAPAEPARPRFSDLAPGMVMEGTVTRIEKYGAFVNLNLADRREGLIHISEMAPHRIRRVEDVVKVGDSVKARIVSIDTERRRIGLSLNEIPDDSAAQQPPAAPLEPTKTAMQMAFEEARSRRKEEMEAERTQEGGAVGSRKKREQEELMNRLHSSE